MAFGSFKDPLFLTSPGVTVFKTKLTRHVPFKEPECHIEIPRDKTHARLRRKLQENK